MISKISFGSREPRMVPDVHFQKMQALLDAKFQVKPVEPVRLFGGETPQLKAPLKRDTVEFTTANTKTFAPNAELKTADAKGFNLIDAFKKIAPQPPKPPEANI